MIDDFDEKEMFSANVAKNKNSNPLAGYFRVPGLHVKLPTNGAFLGEGGISLTMTGEVPVYPMRAADELLLKSPDALMSGYAIEELIRSCVPAIKNPRLISNPDLEVLLLAIRAASFGEKMEINVTCPHCEHENEFDCHIPGILSTTQDIPAENAVRLSPEVMVYLRPFNFANGTKVALATFEETRKVQMVENESNEVRSRTINAGFRRMTELNIEMLADCVIQVVVPEGVVTDKKAIYEFIQNIPREWVHKIDESLKGINAKGLDKRVQVQCQECQHEWTTEVEFDPASFFGVGS